jgi:CBS domain-containing protein
MILAGIDDVKEIDHRAIAGEFAQRNRSAGVCSPCAAILRRVPKEPRRNPMQVKDAMTTDVELASPTQTIRQAALLMGKNDCGALPVADKDSLVGMITDRDITIRAVAAGKGPRTLVRDIMSAEVLYCFEDQELDEVARNLSDKKVRRLPVMNREKRLVGILSLGDMARKANGTDPAADALKAISQPGGEHSQTTAH